jgi:hypothetical protein
MQPEMCDVGKVELIHLRTAKKSAGGVFPVVLLWTAGLCLCSCDEAVFIDWRVE